MALRFRLAFLATLFVSSLAASPPAQAEDTLVGVDMKGLDADERTSLTSLMKEAVCPCNPRSSMFDCINEKKCDKALDLARFGADKYREGMGDDQVRQAIVQKYFDDNMTFDWFELKDSPRKGAAAGRVVMVEFADFECPYCSQFARILTEVVKAYPNDVTLYFKNFPLPNHQWSDLAARATLAAGKQGKYWQMNELIFEHQMDLSADKFTEFAAELGLNVPKFKADVESPDVRKHVDRDRNEGIKANLGGTPTLYINGKLYLSEKTPEAIKAHVEKLLKATPKK